MKKKTSKAALLVLSAILMSLVGLTSAEAVVSELGDICLSLAPDVQIEQSGGVIQVGVLSYGSGHFVLHGQIIGAGIGVPNGPAHGTAMFDGTKIVMSLTNTNTQDINNSSNYSVSFSALHIVLSGPTYSGRYVLWGPELGGGTVTVVPCN